MRVERRYWTCDNTGYLESVRLDDLKRLVSSAWAITHVNGR